MQITVQYLKISVAFLLLFPAQLAAEQCSFEQWIVDLQVATVDFIDHIESANAREKAGKLQQTADKHSLVALRSKLKNAGLGEHDALFKRFSARQKILLQSFLRSGAQQAIKTGQVSKLENILKDVETVVRKLDCAEDPNWEPTAGSVSMFGFLTNMHPAWSWGVFLFLVTTFGGSLTLYSGYQQKLIRQTKRYPCNIDVDVSLSNHSHKVPCLDISQTGMKVRLNLKCNQGTPCSVKIGTTNTTGKIVWSNAEYSGVAFTKGLEETFISHIVKT